MNLVESLHAQIADDPVSDDIVDVIHDPLRRCREENTEENPQDDLPQGVEVDVAPADDFIHAVADIDRNEQLQNDRQGCECKR